MHADPDHICTPDSELTRLSNEQLIEFIVEQRDRGCPRCAMRAAGILAWGYEQLVHYLVAKKVPAEEVDDRVGIVLEAALRSVFKGTSVGEFVNWLKEITRRRGIADYHREREGDPRVDPLGSENEGEEEIFGPEPAEGDMSGVVHIREAAGRVLERRSPEHQRVIRLYGPNALGFLDLSARETVVEFERLHPGQSMSEANVHQIATRFKKDLDDELGMRAS